ncbi:Amino acid ABC transporter, periplasmic amino acid-binding protein [Serinicoccus hydrothermalis]|uniref:Amino acid ABC transporter, periplasmic amino acid-binding protein n=1 Tax=Serinicoccus hydrothermalis TaxID=1758689 RepID=A0A1B1NG16_9MICO|nr:transporter substrate-binding domain-containing protein [Serinicoccus hydrothermalis]ANS80347.1 Amino acid ABC transporter, periplasmic amino acid-binding protein [Serinicoccus hydrothermalis]
MTASRTSLVLAAVTALTLSACGSDTGSGEPGGSGEAGGVSGDLIDDGTLVVAMSGEFQPFSYFDGNELTGFDYEIGAAVADELGLEMQSETAAFASLIGGVQANRYDVLIASMTPTEERDEAVDFTDGYYSSGAQAFVASGTDCTDVSELDSPTVGVATGTTYQDYLEEEGGDWVGEVRTFDSDVVALRDLGTGRLDAVMTDRLVGLYQIEQAGLDVVECGDPLYTESPAFAVKEGNSGLVDDLNGALATIVEDGTYGEISEKYFGQDISGDAAGSGSTDEG